MFARQTIMLITFSLFLAFGLFWPDALTWLLQTADAVKNWSTNQFNLTGYAGLVMQLSGFSLALVLSAFAIGVGVFLRWSTRRFLIRHYFTWNRILTATFLPLLAHVIKWVLGYFAAWMLFPVYQLTQWLLTRFSPTWQVNLEIFGGRDLFANAIIVTILLMIWQLPKLFKRRPKRRSRKTRSSSKKMKGVAMKALKQIMSMIAPPYKFNPITWNLVFRPLAGIVLGSFYTSLVYGLVAVVAFMAERDMSIPFLTWIGLTVFIGSLGVLPEGSEVEKVPETRYTAMVTLWGIPLGWLLRETGDYPWIGKRLGLGRTKRTTPEFTDKNGFIKAGEIPFAVWDSANRVGEDENAKGDTVIKAPAKNRALISATLILILKSVRPRLMLDSNDPELDIGESARQEFREMVGNFVDTDLQHLQQHTIDVLMGTELITCFLPESTYGQKAGGMIHDKGGKVMFEMIDKSLTPTQRRAVIKKFKARVRDHAKEHMYKLVTEKDAAGKVKKDKDGNVEIRVDYVEVEKPITKVIEGLGFELVRGTFGDIILSKKVTDMAEEASSEPDQRIIRIESAKTNKQARKELLPDKEEQENPFAETGMVLEAAADAKNDNIQVVFGHPLAQAAVAGASQINKGKDKK